MMKYAKAFLFLALTPVFTDDKEYKFLCLLSLGN